MTGSTDDDLEFMHEQMRDVAPLGKRSKSARAGTAPSAPAQRKDDTSVDIAPIPSLRYEPIPGSAILDWRRPGLLDRQYQALRTGRLKPAPQEYDLHGLKPEQAAEYIHQAIAQTQSRQQTALCVIHGKGLRSGPEGSLAKGVTDSVLRLHPEVLGFHSAPGNTGAVNVLLRKGRL